MSWLAQVGAYILTLGVGILTLKVIHTSFTALNDTKSGYALWCVTPCSIHRFLRIGGTIFVHAFPEDVHTTFLRNVAIYIHHKRRRHVPQLQRWERAYLDWHRNYSKSPTLRSLKKTELRAQSTCENRFWSSTLHISSNKSTSHWLYVWFCSSSYRDFCHSRSSTDCTKSRNIGENLTAVAVVGPVPAVAVDVVLPELAPFGNTPSKGKDFGERERGEGVVGLDVAHSFVSIAPTTRFPVVGVAACPLQLPEPLPTM